MKKYGLVEKAIAGFFYVNIDGETYECKSSTKLKRNKKKILPGDEVVVMLEEKYIIEIIERTNELIRPKIANVRNAILVFSLTQPKMNFSLLDRFLMIMEFNGLKSTILFTKDDLIDSEDLKQLKNSLSYYEKIGYKVFYKNEFTNNNEIDDIFEEGEKYVVTGQTGVGKSTFLNQILDKNIKTQEISKALGRGKHTTRETTFYRYKKDIYLIDTPGFSSLDLDLEREAIRDNFVDFRKLAGDCKFNGCFHKNEPGCNVKKKYEENEILASRYKNYLKLLEEK